MPRALDRALDLAFGATPKTCDTCGAPNPDIGSVVVLDSGISIVECPDCGGSVTDAGISLTPPFETDHFTVIRLVHDPPGLPRSGRPA